MQNNNVAIVDNTTSATVGAMCFPKNSLYLDTRKDQEISIWTLGGRQVTNFLIFSEYKDDMNAPYATFADALAGIQAVIFA